MFSLFKYAYVSRTYVHAGLAENPRQTDREREKENKAFDYWGNPISFIVLCLVLTEITYCTLHLISLFPP